MNFDSSEAIFIGDSEMAALMRSYDWSQTSLGAVNTWSQSLKTAVRIMVTSRQAMFVWWGDDLINLYNDAYRAILGGKHPEALGQPAAIVWQEIWDQVGPRAATALQQNQGTYDEALLLIMERNGYPEETYYTFSYSPVPDDDGSPGGIICANTEDTPRMIGERQLALLKELAAKTADARTFDQACRLSANCLATNLYDLPFAMIYLIDPEGRQVTLAGTSGIERGHPAVPETVALNVALNQDTVWHFATVANTHQPYLITDLASQFGDLPSGAWDRPPHQAVVLPIAASGRTGKAGILVSALNPFRLFDDNYQGFLNLVSAQIAASIANAQAYEEERKRAEALAELDRSKTVFFSNISHEFRTPLTLMLGPLEEAIGSCTDLFPPEHCQQLEMVHRNGLRLLKLVNTLLDFSRIEAGRIQAVYEPTDLALLTADLAGVFRSAIERVGIRLVVDCPALPEPIYIDREMWEKIVLNLLSNAFKFTFAGEICVRLRWIEAEPQKATQEATATTARVELEVRDTGTGIPAEELPHIFERFHRVRGAKGRTYEGSGIGLSLVQELVQLHGGKIEVSSEVDQGTSFVVSIPAGSAHLPPEQIGGVRHLASTATGSATYVEEILRWLPTDRDETAEPAREPLLITPSASAPLSVPFALSTSPAHILLADDNTDMRDYVQRLLLSQGYTVETAADGIAALTAARQRVPDLVLTDVMMPQLDGFGLLQALRSDPATSEVPIILLSARAGEEARIEGLAAGADDYLTKPFAARELLARVEATLKLVQLRQESTQREQVLRLEAEAFKVQLESVLAGINDQFIVLDREWRYTFVNEQVMAVTGRSKEELLGQSIWDVFPDVIGSAFDIQVRRAVAEQTVVRIELFYPPLKRWFENRIYPFVEGVTIFVTDISDRKRAETEREHLLQRVDAARIEAEQANRIKDEFLAVLSHELRSPLNPILGWSKLLRSHQLDAQKTEHALEIIERNARIQAQLINDLLEVSRILRGKLSLDASPVDLVSTIRAAIETVRLGAEAKSIQIQTLFAPDVGYISGDPNRLQQVVWNLLSNAVKFTPEGGRIEIRLERVEIGRNEQAISSSTSAPSTSASSTLAPPLSSYAQITVADTGKGIDPQFLPYVFDHFRQEDAATTRRFGGLGLGLAIVRYLVELHGGIVQADSAGEGQGATFTIKLPLMPHSPTTHPEPQPPEPLLDLDGIKILVVDDDDSTREFLVFLLELHGANVITAASASEALAALAQFQPDILLSDIGMPEMDGYMLMQEIQSQQLGGEKLPAIALTAYAGELNQQQALAAGFRQHLPKPVEPETLIKAIATLVLEGN